MQIKDENHEAVVAELRRAALILMGGRGIPAHEILIVTHAWVMTEMAAQFGPEVAADCARKAVKRMEAMPTEIKLAAMGDVPVRSVQ